VLGAAAVGSVGVIEGYSANGASSQSSEKAAPESRLSIENPPSTPEDSTRIDRWRVRRMIP